MLRVLKGASMLLPNSKSEYLRLNRDTGREFPFHVVPNGVDKEIFSGTSKDIVRQKKVISVALASVVKELEYVS
jgi:hypothetical protein